MTQTEMYTETQQLMNACHDLSMVVNDASLANCGDARLDAANTLLECAKKALFSAWQLLRPSGFGACTADEGEWYCSPGYVSRYAVQEAAPVEMAASPTPELAEVMA